MSSRPRLPEPDGLREAFWAHERALTAGDGAALAGLVAPGPATVLGDADGLRVGHDAVAATLRGRAATPRRVTAAHVQTVDADHALVVAVLADAAPGAGTAARGQQTQLWARTDEGWRVTATHLSAPAPAFDPRIWREVGDPLVPASGAGPLVGRTVAVKDTVAVAGRRRGAGVDAWLARATPERQHAPVVEALLEAGAAVRGLARCDELAWSLTGDHPVHGAPPNPAAPGRLPGGSTSGPASAVALGHADVGLGTDTAGSVRVPASYQGLWGVRTTHGAVPRGGVLPLAGSYDAVGWLTRDPDLLAAVGDVLLPAAPTGPAGAVARPGSTELVVCSELLAVADPEVAGVVEAYADRAGMVLREPFDASVLPGWRQAFSTVQAHEAHHAHGRWVAARADGEIGDDVRGRFAAAAGLDADDVRRAVAVAATARRRVLELVGDRVLLLPAAPGVAPRLDAGREELARTRETTLRLTCLAGLAGLPAVTVPGTTAGGLPAGVCLLAAPGRDRDLLDLARRLHP
ncbi:hypothetical protein GCM10009737_19500 [Nocardioides lentus]|uniref:Amidase domain-containing protein n=1 Tax=Nocardioides lentus TaxID=338077 RepID=A0ABN2PDX8_9ACTN